VSKWSVGEQLEHVARANGLCVAAIEKLADGEGEARGGPTVAGRLVLLAGRIPRGRGTAPDPSRPQPGTDAGALRGELAKTRERTAALLSRLDGIRRSRVRRPHPVLGSFNARQWVRFAGVHARHHVAIVRDILARAE